MKTRATLLYVFLFLAVCCAAAQAQAVTPSITVGGVEIKFGAPAESVVAALQKDYLVVPDGKSPVQRWLVFTDKKAIPSLKAMHADILKSMPDAGADATLFVKGNSIVGASSNHALMDTQDIFAALYAAATKFSGEGHNNCSVTTANNYVPLNMSNAVFFLNCGVYKLAIERTVLGSDTGYMVWEYLGSTD